MKPEVIDGSSEVSGDHRRAALRPGFELPESKFHSPAARPGSVSRTALVDRLAAQTKGVFILEHRSGAGGTISAQAVVQAPPDGNTLLFTTSSISAAPAFYPKLGFDPLVALTPISLITEIPIGLVR